MGGILSLREHFVGRADELLALGEAFNLAADGHTTVVAVTGDAGIGKSRIVTEFFRIVRERAFGLARGHCLEHLRAPFLPVIEILRDLQLDAAASLLPHQDPSPARGSQELQVRAFREASRHLCSAPPNRPYVLNVEDVQWADAATLSFLEYLVCTQTRAPLLVVLTLRAEAFEHPTGFARTLARMRAAGLITIPLRPLDRSEMSHLIRDAAPAPISRQSAERIKALAEGNPLFAEELLRAVLDEGQDAITHPAFSSIRTTVLEHFYELSEADQQVLYCAAVIGRVFDVRLIARLLGRRLVDVLAGIRRARNLQLVREESSGSHCVAFRHPIFCDVIYRELLAVELRELHGRVAAALEEGSAAAEHESALAYHWSKAGDDAKALHYNMRAGDAAVKLAAYEDAAHFYDSAFERTEPQTLLHAEVAEKRAYAWYAAGVQERTDELFATALAAYEQLGQHQKVVGMHLFLSRQAWNDVQTPRGYAYALQAAELIGPNDDALRDYALTMAASYAVHLGNPDEAIALLEHTKPTKDPAIAARRFDTIAIARCRLGDAPAVLETMQAAQQAADASGDPDLVVRVYSNSADLHAVYGDSEAALASWRRAFTAAQEGGFIGRMAYAALGYAWACIDAGDLERARRLYATAMETGVKNASVVLLEQCVGALLGTLRAASGTASQALDLAVQSRETLRIGQAGSALALAALSEQRNADAESILERAVTALEAPDFAETLLLLGSLYGGAATRSRARDLLESLAQRNANVLARAAYDTVLAHERTGTIRAATLRAAAERWSEMRRPQLHALVLSLINSAPVPSRRVRAVGLLTRREVEIARLVADGLSNRTISDRLGISERTVEHHVASVLAQLGIRSRWLITPQLLEPHA